MEDIIKRIQTAKNDGDTMNALVSDYLPFLKKEIAKLNSIGLAYDERLSLAMLVFVNCIKQYDENKGNFISFLSVSIKNRLIDQQRQSIREIRTVPLENDKSDFDNDVDANSIENDISIQRYKKDEEEHFLRDEIEAYNEELSNYSLSFSTLKDKCPRQKRSRYLCIKASMEIVNDPEMREKFTRTGQLPQAEVALRTAVSVKTIEKYRQYIIALIILRLGNYSAITSFIPFYETDELKK